MASEKPPGTNATGVRAYNERLILSFVRRHGSLPKAEITKLTGRSAQTISVIVRALEADGLLPRMEPRRGRIGQPSVPLRLDPDGAYSLGLKIGRRSANLILMGHHRRRVSGGRAALVDRVREKVIAIDLQGLSPFNVIEGSDGANARSIGGASLPLFARYLLDRDVFFKEDV
jgi:hypothetical protein